MKTTIIGSCKNRFHQSLTFPLYPVSQTICTNAPQSYDQTDPGWDATCLEYIIIFT